MAYSGKIIGGCLGFIFGRIPGLGIGIFIGHLYDSGHFALNPFHANPQEHRQKTQTAFFNTTFQTMGHIAKADGRVSQLEIQHAQQVMEDMGLNSDMRREAIRLFQQGKQPGFAINQALHNLRAACWRHPSLLRTFIEIQIKMAYADGQQLSASKKACLQHILQQLGIRGFRFHQQGGAGAQPQRMAKDNLKQAYQTLGVPQGSSEQTVKKAYRKQMSENHPDKMIAKGLPPEMIKVATEKTQQIKQAYELIKENQK